MTANQEEATLSGAELLLEGTIIKGYSGFYYVACGDKLYECSLRGKNRKKNVKFLPGDRVQFSNLPNGKEIRETTGTVPPA